MFSCVLEKNNIQASMSRAWFQAHFPGQLNPKNKQTWKNIVVSCNEKIDTVKDSDLNFFWAPKLSAGGLNFGLDSQYGN